MKIITYRGVSIGCDAALLRLIKIIYDKIVNQEYECTVRTLLNTLLSIDNPYINIDKTFNLEKREQKLFYVSDVYEMDEYYCIDVDLEYIDYKDDIPVIELLNRYLNALDKQILFEVQKIKVLN